MINKRVVVISKYPCQEEMKDGMMQRVVNIDNHLLSKYNRIYLDIKIKKSIKFRETLIKSDVKEYKLHLLKNYLRIYRILKDADILYVHSILNFAKLIPFLPFITEKNIILDFHGVVPEEQAFVGNNFKAYFYKIVEKLSIKYSKHVIFVTKAMKQYITSKYNPKKYKYEPHVLGVFTKNVFKNVSTREIKLLMNRYKISKDDVVFIYSGGTDKWQNIDLMLSCINKIRNVKNYKFILLTNNMEIMKNKLKEFGLISCSNIIIDSVTPENLGKFYSVAHYGFILRDDHILNKVACPTKLVEYMWYGIIPIVKYEEIGDFKGLGYEYVKYEQLDGNLEKKKSNKNKEIIEYMLNLKFNFENLLKY